MNKKIYYKIIYLFLIFSLIFVVVFDNLLFNKFQNVFNYLYKQVGIYNSNIDKYKDDLSVHYIDVGQGDSSLIIYKDKNILIDTGNIDSSKKLLNYIDRLRIDTIDLLVITHQHMDHMGGSNTLISSKKVKNIMMPKLPKRLLPTSNYYKSLLNLIIKNNINVIDPSKINVYKHEDFIFEILSNRNKDYKNINDWSIVVKLSYKNKNFLFTGDCEKESENDLLLNRNSLNSDVLKVSHHGSNTSSSNEFLKLVSPTYSVISVGKNNNYGHPDKMVLDRLKQYSQFIFRTDLDGNIIFYLYDGNLIYEKTK